MRAVVVLVHPLSPPMFHSCIIRLSISLSFNLFCLTIFVYFYLPIQSCLSIFVYLCPSQSFFSVMPVCLSLSVCGYVGMPYLFVHLFSPVFLFLSFFLSVYLCLSLCPFVWVCVTAMPKTVVHQVLMQSKSFLSLGASFSRTLLLLLLLCEWQRMTKGEYEIKIKDLFDFALSIIQMRAKNKQASLREGSSFISLSPLFSTNKKLKICSRGIGFLYFSHNSI